MKTPHPHYDKLIAIANGEQMQYDEEDCYLCYALNAIAAGSGHRVRVKPSTIMIGSVGVPEPMREAPKKGGAYWLVSLEIHETSQEIWIDAPSERRRLNTGLIQATEQGAKDMLAALLKQLKA
jgi:hypothetical protein